MKPRVFILFCVLITFTLSATTASANVLSTSGITVISPPASVARNTTESNDTIFLFAEKQNIILENDAIVDIASPGTYGAPTGGTIAAGSCVNSYFIQYDLVDGEQYRDGSIVFEEQVLGVITANLNLDASDWLGASGTFYGNSVTDGEIFRGLELASKNPDSVSLSTDGMTLSFHLYVKQDWQDQIRVITQGNCEQEPPGILEVLIDVKPNSDPSCFNSDGKGVIPVAILGSADFDVRQIDPSSLELDGAPVAPRKNNPNKLRVGYSDYNGDGFEDMIPKFVDIDNYTKQDKWAELTGTLFDGTPIYGSGDICITN